MANEKTPATSDTSSFEDYSIDPTAIEMLEIAEEMQIETAFSRSREMKPCSIGAEGSCCKVCAMGPCRLVGKHERGVCGATRSTVAARNFLRQVAVGAASHSDHGRDAALALKAIASGEIEEGTIADTVKLAKVAANLGITDVGKDPMALALEVADRALQQFGQQTGELEFIKRAPAKRQELWRSLDVVPRGIDREIVEALHRTHAGTDQNYVSLLDDAVKCSLGSGWGGSMLATDLQDVLYGTPQPVRSAANLGVLSEDKVNIVIHGHEPLLASMILDATAEPEMLELAKSVGAAGINVAGICCTANESLMRKGVPPAGNMLHQELAVLTGAVEAMVVDVQCIFQGLTEVAEHFHTKLISSSSKARIGDSEQIVVDEHKPRESARKIVREAIENFPNRGEVHIPKVSEPLVAGFSHEYIRYMLGGKMRASLNPLNENIVNGRIRGLAAVVGCSTPRSVQDYGVVNVVRELIANNVLVVVTGCAAITSGKHGLLTPETMEFAGPTLKEVCEAIGIPPVLHVGSCVDNSRILTILADVVETGGLGDDISGLPAVAISPEWFSEKALEIATYAVGSGADVIFGGVGSPVAGSPEVEEYMISGWRERYGGSLRFIHDAADMASAALDIIDEARRALKIDVAQERILFDMDMRRELSVSKIIASAAIRGAHAIVGRAETTLAEVKEAHGAEHAVELPNTGYYLPVIYGLTGEKVEKLSDMDRVLEMARGLLPEAPSEHLWLPYLGGTLDAGIATLLAEECIEAMTYITQDPPPVTDLWLGAADDVIMRAKGVEFVDGSAPGFAAVVGAAPDNETAVSLAREMQQKMLYVFMAGHDGGTSFGEQLAEEGIQLGWDTRLVPFGKEVYSQIYSVGFATRAAMAFGGVQPGDYERILDYNKRRVFAFVLALGEVTDEWYATAAGAISYGFPTIATSDIPQILPTGVCTYEHVVSNISCDELVQKAIEVRGLKIKVVDLPIPVAYGPAFEGERVRKEDTFVEAGGQRSTAFELVRTRDASEVEDGKIEVVGPDLDELEEGTRVPLGIVVDVAGRKMQSDFEPVIERQFHHLMNFAEGVLHMGQRELIWIRVSKAAKESGFMFRHLGDILHAKIHDDFEAIVDKVQVTIYTEQDKVEEMLDKAKLIYALRDERMADLADNTVDTFYSCSLCQSFAPNHVCVVTPERLGLCGAYNWLDAKASNELNPTGPNQPIAKGVCIDPVSGQWTGVNEFIYEQSGHAVEKMSCYSLMTDPMTSCGCFMCIISLMPMCNGVMIVNREFAGMTPSGMKFSTLAGMVGGGIQTPGFMGVGRGYLASKKFLGAEGGLPRVVWMPKELKDAMAGTLRARCEEIGKPELFDQIADETIAETEDALLEYLTSVGHPALTMDPMF